MVTRRSFLRIGSVAGAGLVSTGAWRLSRGVAQAPPLNPAMIRRYTQPLFAPAVIDAATAANVSVPVRQIMQQVLDQSTAGVAFPQTAVWGYGSSFPGPTFDVRRGIASRVQWVNDLGPGSHLLPVDYTLHGTYPHGMPSMPYPDRRLVTHLHGGEVSPEDDGYPEAWYTWTGDTAETRPGRPSPRDTYDYPNSQPPATLWYHDHALGITRLNVYAGMAGFYLLRDEWELASGLPTSLAAGEIPLAIQDRMFDIDGQLWYPDMGMNGVNPVWVPEFFGDVAVVNGRAWPFLNVEPRRYRLRLLNGCTSRFLNLQFLVRSGNSIGTTGPVLIQIGTDVGFLPAPVNLALGGGNNPARLLLGPGERADVIVDFSGWAGRTLVLHNNAPTPFAGSATAPGGFGPYPGGRHFVGGTVRLDEIMEFRVGTTASGNFQIPATLPSAYVDPGIAPGQLPAGVPVRVLELGEILNAQGVPLMAIVQDVSGNLMWEEPINAMPISGGSREVWLFVNTTADTHPMHLHLVQFRPLWRRSFKVKDFVLGQPIPYQGAATAVNLNERGMKDTVRANPGEVTAILVDFPTGFSGYYPVHCHILEHEDHEMMREYLIA